MSAQRVLFGAMAALCSLVTPGCSEDRGTTPQTVQVLDTRTHLPLEEVRVRAEARKEVPRCGDCPSRVVARWTLTTDANGSFTVAVPDESSFGIVSLEKTGYTTNWRQTVDDERLQYEPDRRDRIRYLIPTVDVTYEYVRYLYRHAANALENRKRYFAVSPGSNMGWAYRKAKESAQTDRERLVLLAFCRHRRAMQAEEEAGWPTTGVGESRDNVRTLIEDCGPFAHDADPGSSAGYVTDADGVDPIPGAVVSVVLRYEGAQVTRSETLQARAGPDGYFEVDGKAANFTTSPGEGVTPRPQLRVYALGRDVLVRDENPFAARSNTSGSSVASEPADVSVIPLSRPRFSEQELNAQVEAWALHIQQALRESGAKQALAQYRPLLDLLAESCALLSSRFQIELVSCKNALATFGIERTPEIRVQLNFPPPLDLRTGDEDPAIVIGPTEDSALQSQEQLPPPTDPGRN